MQAPIASQHDSPMNFHYFFDRLKQPIAENHIQGMILSGLISTIFTLNPLNIVISVGLSFLASRIDIIVRPVINRFIAPLLDSEIKPSLSNLITILFVTTVTIGISSSAAGLIGSAYAVDKLITFLITLGSSSGISPIHVFC
jgi:hypothetical protein